MFLQARVDKAKLQQDEQHQNQADLEQLDKNCLFSVNHEYYRKYFSPPTLYKIKHLVNTLLTKIKYHAQIHNLIFFFWMCFTYLKQIFSW